MRALIVGGTSGLGLELANCFLDSGYADNVTVTGRHDPEVEGISYRYLELNDINLSNHTALLLEELGEVDIFVYAAGFPQMGTIDQLSEADIMLMAAIGLTAPAFLLRQLLLAQESLPIYIAITSTSQFKPRMLEPMYTATKSALAMLAKSIAEDPRVGKTLVAAPAGMDTPFWDGMDMDTSDWLDPHWVALEIVLDAMYNEFRYREIRFDRGSSEVEVFECY